jgi:enoyl-CoA hydratase/carnithine racemase
LHLLFARDDDIAACDDAGPDAAPHRAVPLEERACSTCCASEATEWLAMPASPALTTFLASLSQEKRKKIRQERRKVADAGVTFRWARAPTSAPRLGFFYRCYERTYLEHGNAPYLSRDFFQRMARTMPQHWVLFVAERDGQPIATSLIDQRCPAAEASAVAYGRYWGALERVDCLHFEACYYQPLQWCIEHGVHRFEGGAQGEHKMARALLPVQTTSAHWLAHPAFADAVERFLEREALWRCSKPTIAKVHGYAVAGGSDIALCCDMLVMADDARIGYMPTRVWGCPTTAMWTYRIGAIRAKQLMFTGDTISGAQAADWGLANMSVPAAELDDATQALARRIAGVPKSHLAMHKLVVNQVWMSMGLEQTQMFATVFDGITRHNPEGMWFRRQAQVEGFKNAVEWRDSGRPIPEGDEARALVRELEAKLAEARAKL